MPKAPKLSTHALPASAKGASAPLALRIARVALALAALAPLSGLAFAPAARADGDPPPPAPPLEVGFGRRSLVTSIDGLSLGGYGGRGLIPLHGLHDAVFAKAMVIRTPERTVALVALDLIGVQRTILDALAARPLPAAARLRPEDIVMTASHTHSSYGGLAQRTGGWYLDALFLATCGPFHPRFFDEVTGKIHAALLDAIADLAPARLGVGAGLAPGLQRNRGRGGAPTDPEIGVVKVTSPDGALRGLVINFTGHPVMVPGECLLVSADYPGALQRILEERHPGATVLFTNGAEGDQTATGPEGPHRDHWARIEAAGARIADHVERIAATIEAAPRVRVEARRIDVAMPRPDDLRARIKWTGGAKRGLVQNLIIGDALFMGLPGEPCCQIGLDLKAAAKARGFRHAFVLGLCQDHLGYFVHADDYAPEHALSHDYEKSLNFYGPGVGAFFLDVHMDRLAPLPLAER